jgi:hypothetical protein
MIDMFGNHFGMAKSIAEGRREQLRKSAVKRKEAGTLHKKKRKKGLLGVIKTSSMGEEVHL